MSPTATAEEHFVIGDTVTVYFYECSWCRQMIPGSCLVQHLIEIHADRAGARRARRRIPLREAQLSRVTLEAGKDDSRR